MVLAIARYTVISKRFQEKFQVLNLKFKSSSKQLLETKLF